MKRLLVCFAFWCFPMALWCQPVLPEWLTSYPGAIPHKTNMGAMTAITYTTDASTDAVSAHYKALFENQNVDFAPVSNRFNTTVHAKDDCGDLTITITARGTGSSVRVSCATKLPPAVLPAQTGSYEDRVEAMKQQHEQRAAQLGIGRALPPAPAPPLIWPDWLVHPKGAQMAITKTRDQAGVPMMRTRFVTSVPMSQLFVFYKDLLTKNGYEVYRGTVQTGQTQSGIQQNAHGGVEGSWYPDGFPGPRIEIRVDFDRMHLNDPITVDIRFTPYAFAGRPGRDSQK